MNNHSARPTSSMVVPEAHANVAKNSRNRNRGRGKGKWKGKRGAMFKGKEKGKPKGRVGPKKQKGDHNGEEQGDCYRCGAKGHWSYTFRAPNIANNISVSISSTNSSQWCTSIHHLR